ncbi:MAG: L-threonylcarbamoyladenylate synthase [Chthoniobacterales bacterium]
MKTEILPAGETAIAAAVTALRAGEAVALPTETVYGLAADALNPTAVARIFEAKERPRFDPLIVHLPDRFWLDRLTQIPSEGRKVVDELTAAFWPGPLTLVLPRTRQVPDLVTAGLDHVAVRLSAHPVLAAILESFGQPLAAPSANRFGRISPTAAAHVLEELAGRIRLIVDGGPTVHGLESTIVAVRDSRLEVLRRGPVTTEQLCAFGEVVERHGSTIEAPGQMPSHYAPRTPLVLADDIRHFAGERSRCGLLAWRSAPAGGEFAQVRVLSPRGDLREAAANLFRLLRDLDHYGLDAIVAETMTEEGLGAAIMDRLRRAAA